MATSVLTPNSPDPVTGLIVPFIGWHFVAASVDDVLLGCNTIYVATSKAWLPDLKPIQGVDTMPPPWQIQFIHATNAPVEVLDTQWFGYDGTFIRVLDESDVTANYTVTNWTAPNPSS